MTDPVRLELHLSGERSAVARSLRAAADELDAATMPDPWVIEDTSARGDVALFWAANRCGYTDDLARAGRYSREEAIAQERSRPTDRAHRLADVLPLARPRVDRDKLVTLCGCVPLTGTTCERHRRAPAPAAKPGPPCRHCGRPDAAPFHDGHGPAGGVAWCLTLQPTERGARYAFEPRSATP